MKVGLGLLRCFDEIVSVSLSGTHIKGYKVVIWLVLREFVFVLFDIQNGA